MTRQALVTVRPGPVLHVWRDGREVARVPLGLHGGLALLRALAGALGQSVGSFRGDSGRGNSQAQRISSHKNFVDVPPQPKGNDR